MDRNPQCNPLWCIIILISLCTHTESRLVYYQGSGAGSQHPSSRTHSYVQTVGKQQQSAELSVRPRPVVVHCHPDSMEVVVRADMFDSGLEVDAGHLRLGSGPPREVGVCRAEQSGEAEFTIRASLTDCGIQLSSSEEKIIYSTVLFYSPELSDDGLLRLDGATIPVECHYDKRYSVDGISLHPTWLPSVSTILAEDHIDFNLLLMTSSDWRYKRESYSYFLGDPIHFEVSAIIRKHMPLRVYVDRCVATATPDAESSLRYDFIEHFGCLADTYLTNSTSHFLPRVAEHKLRFQVDAFRFYQESSNQVYITCDVKAVPVTRPVNSQNRACSLIENRWRSVDGNEDACRSCDLSNRVEEHLATEPSDMSVRAKERPSMMPQQSLAQNRPKQHQVGNFHHNLGVHQRQHNNRQQSFAGLMKRGAGRTVQLGPITILPSSKTDTSSTDSKIPSKSKTI